MAPTKAAAAKKQRLTLAQLSSYDDILTDALVDHVFYWTTVPKNRSSYHPSRGVREDEIAKILQDEVVVNKDLAAAEKKLLNTDGLRRFNNGLKTAHEKENFRQHLRRYLQIYSTDCPWEVNSTNRYTIVSHEAAVTARRLIKRNEPVKYLSGIQVTITPEEEKEITRLKKDFSIVVSSRNKCTNLFMGPARFANHDCRANAKLMTTSHSGIEIIATRTIEPGDEITVTYGENYFGEDNYECLCQSCETGLRNGWEPEEGATLEETRSTEEIADGYSLRRRRRDDSLSGSRTPSVTPDIRPKVMKRMARSSHLSQTRDSSAAPSPADNRSPHGRKRPIDTLATPPKTPAKKLKQTIEPILMERSSSNSSATSGCGSSSGTDAMETDVTSPEKESPEATIITPSKQMPGFKQEMSERGQRGEMNQVAPYSPQSSDDAFSPQKRTLRPQPSRLNVPNGLSAMSISAILNSPVVSEFESDANTETNATSIAISIEAIDASQAVGSSSSSDAGNSVDMEIVEVEDVKKPKRKYKRREFLKESTPPARVRTPGDYVLTHLLLAQPDMAWIQCINCNSYFVQQNAYYTRSSCPRCERHSKLYGYIWPKTDKEGARDKEERVLDHRTIHRFLDSNDERKVRGHKTMALKESEEPEESPRGRNLERRKVGRPRKVVTETPVEEEESSVRRRSGRLRIVSSRLADE